MKRLWKACLIAVLNLLLASRAMACSVPTQPWALVGIEADAIVLVQITHSGAPAGPGRPWIATGASRGMVWGSAEAREFSFEGAPGGSCWNFGKPRLERYWLVYLKKSAGGVRVQLAAPFWWARTSEDKRLLRLDTLMPLGAARLPTREEETIIRLAEPRVKLPAGAKNLSGYTRIYAHSSSSTFRVAMFPSRNPRRLIVDSFEEWPTRESCRCALIEQMIDIQDLRDSGRIPPFDP
jgi:hypothetical protein